MALMAKYPNFKFKVLNASRVMITQGKLQYVHLSQFSAIQMLNIMSPFKMAVQMLPWGLWKESII